MAPTPTPETAPTLDATLVSKTITPSLTNLYLGQNTMIKNAANGGFQTTLPMVTSDAMYSSGLRLLAGSTRDILQSDNLTIDNLGNLTKVGTITSTGDSSFSGAVTTGSLSSTGTISGNSVSSTTGYSSLAGNFSTTNGNFSTTNGNFTTTAGKFSGKDLQISNLDLNIDSVTKTINLNGSLLLKNADNSFVLNSTTGQMTTFGDISTSGTGNISAAGSLNASALNIGGTAFKVDSNGALTAKNSGVTIHSVDMAGNLFNLGNLESKGSANFANGKVTIDGTAGNVSTTGTMHVTGAITGENNLSVAGSVNIGTNAITLSNNATSYFKNSLVIGDATTSKHSLNSDGSASLATGNFTLASTGDIVSKGTASFGNNAVTIGTSSLTSAKLSVDSAGNVAAAGTLSVANGNVTFSSTGNATLAGSLVATRDVSAGGLLNATGKATLGAGLDVTGATNLYGAATLGNTLSVASDLAVNTDKFKVTAASGNVSAAGTLSVTGAVTAGSTLNVTGDATLGGKLSVASDLAINTDKFKVTAASGNVSAAGNLSLAGNASVTGTANFSNNQIQMANDGSLFVKNFLKTDFEFGNHVKSSASDDLSTTIVPEVGSAADVTLFNSTTNKYLTTQEYVDRAVFKQAARLNLITKDVDKNLATFNNFSKVLAAIEGSSAATVINGLVDSVDDIKVSVSDLMGGGYNSVVINCVPSVWGDAAAPEPIPTPISSLYKEDGWFYSNMSDDSKINWYLPAYSGMKMKDITNLFMNSFLLSTLKAPKITIYTSPKNNSTDTISGVYNAKIEYYFTPSNPAAETAKRSSLYLIDAPKNVYSDKTNDIKCGYSKTMKGASSANTPITMSTTFATSFDTSLVSSDDNILTFAIETSESTIKDYMFILQNFNISTKNGTTQMLFQNSSVLHDYVFKYFFRQHSDFSDVSLDAANSVDKNNYSSYISGIQGNSISSISSSSAVNPQNHITEIKTLTLGGKVVQYENQKLTFEAGTTSVALVCDLENNTNKLKIMNGLNVVCDKVGDFNGTTMLAVGDNTFVVTIKDAGLDHTKTFTFYAYVKSSSTSLSSFTMNGGMVVDGSDINVPAGTTSVNVVAVPSSALANVLITGATGLVTGANVVNVKVTAEDGVTIKNYTINVHVLSNDTSYTTFTMNGGMVVNGSVRNVPEGTTSVSVVLVPNAQSSGATSVITGASGLVEGDNVVTGTITAEDGTTRTYSFIVHVQNNTSGIASMTIDGISVNLASSTFTLNSAKSSVNVVVTPNSNKSQVVVSSTSNLQVGANTLSIQVTTEQGTANTYTYTLYRQSGDASLSSVYVANQLVNFDSNNNASLTLSNSTPATSMLLNATAHDSNASLTYVLNSGVVTTFVSGANTTITGLVSGANTLLISDMAEDNTIVLSNYTITINNVSNNADLSALTANYSDYPQVNLISSPTLNIGSGLGASVDVTINAASAESHASVSIDGTAGASKTITILAGTTRDIAVLVTAGDGTTTRNYNVTISMPSAISNDASLATFSYATTDDTYFNSNNALKNVTSLDTNNHSITITRTNQNYISIRAMPTHSKATMVVQVPLADRTETLTFSETERLSQTYIYSPSDYYKFEYIGKYGSSGTITITITAEDGTTNTYSITIQVASLSVVAPYLTSQAYLDFINLNLLSDFYVTNAITFDANNDKYMVTLVSNTDTNITYSASETGMTNNSFVNNKGSRLIRMLYFNGTTWNMYRYKSIYTEYGMQLVPIYYYYKDYSIPRFLPISNAINDVLYFTFYVTNIYNFPPTTYVLDFNSYKNDRGIINTYNTYIVNTNDIVFHRFSTNNVNLEYAPQNPFNNNKIIVPFKDNIKDMQFVSNISLNNRTNAVFYSDYQNISSMLPDTSLTNLKVLSVCNYMTNYRATYVLINAVDSDGTTAVNIDNVTFTSVALVGSQLQFTASNGDKYVNKQANWSPISNIDAAPRTYYTIQKVANF